MATYTDIDELRAIWKVPEEHVRTDALQWAAEASYNEINSKLSGVYSVPFGSPYPPKIINISDLMTKTLALMMSVKRGHTVIDEMDFNAGEIHLAMKWLKELRDGDAELPGYSRTYDGAWQTREDYVPIFDLDSGLYHVPDPDLLEDIGDLRDN
jgi:hypothetical protein